jgi:hypothetical protein
MQRHQSWAIGAGTMVAPMHRLAPWSLVLLLRCLRELVLETVCALIGFRRNSVIHPGCASEQQGTYESDPSILSQDVEQAPALGAMVSDIIPPNSINV